MSLKITAKQYIAWVQRSLNRLLGSALVSDGTDTEGYRDQVKEFRFCYVLGSSGEVDRPTQDALIKANYLTPEYVGWAQRAFEKVGASMGGGAGIMDKDTKDAVLSFQGYEDIKDDGWLGPETETWLIAKSGLLPPGHVTAGGTPKPKPPRPKPRPVDPLPIEDRMTRVVNAIIYEIQFNPQVYPNIEQRRRLNCLMRKLKMKQRGERLDGKRIDDGYISRGGGDIPRQYVLGMGVLSYSGGAVPEDLELSAAETLQRNILRLAPDKRSEQEAIRKVVLNLDYDIAGALNSINNLYNVHGENNMGAKLLHRWGMDKQKRPQSILACYT